jgi:small subunit ribosomal protein S17
MVKTEKKYRRLEGVIVSDKMAKTRVVQITRDKIHPKYLKHYTVSMRFKAHDEGNVYKIGDHVIIQETRPLSREKRWRIVGKIEKAAGKQS